MKIIVDAFGGDHAPLEVLKGCALAVKELGVSIIACGDQTVIKEITDEYGISLEQIEISHTEDVILVEDDPSEIMRKHSDSSMGRGLKLLSEGKGDAFVTAGSTGAFVIGSSLIVKRIKGIRRPALATIIPSAKGCYMLMDSGANQECRADMLQQFAVMGCAYMQKIMKIPTPRVGLVNIGTERTKGLALQTESYSLLETTPVNFIGNVEARGLPLGECDVAVTDGFTGNVILKLTEGLGKMFSNEIKGIFFKNAFSKIGAVFVVNGVAAFKRKMDYTEYGGAPLLGIAKPVIKAHGSSNAKAFKNAIRQARDFAENQVIEQIKIKLEEVQNKAVEG